MRTPMEAYVQTLLAAMKLDQLPSDLRDTVIESLLAGYVRVALKYQTVDQVLAALQDQINTVKDG